MDLENGDGLPLGGDLLPQRERRLRGLLDDGGVVADHLVHAVHRLIDLPDPAALRF